MKMMFVAAFLAAGVSTAALAQSSDSSTGGQSGGPNQSQAVVTPEGSTNGMSGGPNQSQAVTSPMAKDGAMSKGSSQGQPMAPGK